MAIEGAGLLELCTACMEFGQKNRRAKKSHLQSSLPSRNTVKKQISNVADDMRSKIADLMRKAINNGGLSATTDCWSDDYRHTSYICVVAHMCIEENNDLSYHRYVLSTDEISEYVKSGEAKKFLYSI